MKRDMELMRSLMLAVEASEESALLHIPTIDGYPRAQVAEHVRLAVDAGYMTARDASTYGEVDFIQLRLTWSGHEFLDNIKDPEIWANTKAGAAKVGTFSFGVIAELAIGYAKAKAQALGLPMM